MEKFALYINTGGECSGGIFRHPNTGQFIEAVDMYDFQGDELKDYAVLLIGTDADQKLLWEKKVYLDDFLASGKTIVFNGAVAYPFLDDVGQFIKMDYKNYEDYAVTLVQDHPVWSGVMPEDIMYRKGVAGFYARGYNPPPANAVIINTLGHAAHPIDYVYEPKIGGKVLIHSGNNLWLFINDETTASKMGTNLIEWLQKEIA